MARRKKAKPLTPSQLQMEKDVKRINERINEVAKLLGTESFAYQQWYSALKLSLPEKYRRTSEHGIVQIARSKELYQRSEQKRISQGIKRLLGMKTMGQLKKEAKKSLREEGIRRASKAETLERVKTIDMVNTFVSEHEDMFYQDKSSPAFGTIHIRGRRKSYEELNFIIEEYNKRVGKGEMFTDIFAGLE